MPENRLQSQDRVSFENSNEESLNFEHKQESAGYKDDGDNYDFEIHPPMPRDQKIIILLLGFLGVGVLVLGIIQIKGILQIPWPDLSDGEAVGDSTQQLSLQESEEEQAMKSKDTDKDGISDYDELKHHNTSPYLDDSDSDGLSDYEEIVKGTDPNCPEGQNCFRYTELSDGSSASASSANSNSQSEYYQPTADDLRTLLINSGQFTQEQIDQISDKELLDFYEQMLEENPDLQEDLQAASTESQNVSQTTTTNLYNYTPDQVREILKQQGISAEELDLIDDETLMQMYQEALDKAADSME